MVILKKARSATLIETLVSSIIIISVFIVASMSINNVFYTNVLNDDFTYTNRIKEIQYLSSNGALTLPFYEDTPEWEISVEKQENTIELNAVLKKNATNTYNIIINAE